MDYDLLERQVAAFADGEENIIGLYANVAAIIKEASKWHWVGFYVVRDDELWLGPFQGPVACLRIPRGKGICGTAWAEDRTIVVDDVDEFPGHIACSSLSRSEIVVPIRSSGIVTAVLDIDSVVPGDFTERDRAGLEKICGLLSDRL